MLKKLYIFLGLFFLLFTPQVYAQVPPSATPTPQQEIIHGYVVDVLGITQLGKEGASEKLDIMIDEGKGKGKTTAIEYMANSTNHPLLHKGDSVILGGNPAYGYNNYYIIDKYRMDKIIYIILIFCLVVLLVTGKKGLRTLLGIGVSLLTVFAFIIPRILAGAEPVSTSVLASFFILFITTYLSHGISKQTTIAFISTCAALVLTVAFSFFAVWFTGLTGYGTSDADQMHFLTPFFLDVKGLLLAGIIITTLGALNDVTITQVTAVFQLAKHKEKLSFLKLAKQGIVIGKEHAISLVNTLVLAYTGATLSLLIYFFVTLRMQPVGAIIGNEFLGEEVVRTVAGTVGLLLAVPIATYLAAYIVTKKVK